MPVITPFHALRPTPSLVERVTVIHRDSVDAAHAKVAMYSNPYSFLHISRAELDMNKHDAEDYDLVKDQTSMAMRDFMDKKILIQDAERSLYIYRLTFNGHSQTGLVACIDVCDYDSGKIKRHELTRDKKIHAQELLLDTMRSNTEPVVLTFDSEKYTKPDFIKYTKSCEPAYDFIDADAIRHELWPVSDSRLIAEWENTFKRMDSFYIADGHHRIAAAAQYGRDKEGEERYLMAAIFPSEEMRIFDYNRAISDLNGMTVDEFIKGLKKKGFMVKKTGKKPVRPSRSREFTMYLDGDWYNLEYTGEVDETDPVASIDVSILQDQILKDLLGIEKPQSDPRLTFISGTKHLSALEKAVDKGSGVAFAIHPANINEVMRVADHGLTMPPKSTYFKPKPLNGIIIHRF